MVKALTLVALLVSCAHTPVYNGYPIPTTQEDCMQLFQDINQLQAVRHELMDQMNQTTLTFEQGRMSRARFQKKRETWLANEARHRRDVTFLYDVGYEYGCF